MVLVLGSIIWKGHTPWGTFSRPYSLYVVSFFTHDLVSLGRPRRRDPGEPLRKPPDLAGGRPDGAATTLADVGGMCWRKPWHLPETSPEKHPGEGVAVLRRPPPEILENLGVGGCHSFWRFR
jgi:hypothetical protein